MEAKTLSIKEEFFFNSPYAREVEVEQDDDSYGLIYDQLFHDIGLSLGVDIVWDHVKAHEAEWVIAKDSEMDILLYDKGVHQMKEVTFVPKTKTGLAKVENVISQYKEEFGDFMF